jgi:hypothetical protein
MNPDMDIQINTLYVGNLPSSPPPPGYGPNHLEDSLRNLFSSQPGYRKLCFRQKSNGPMCFVEVCPCSLTNGTSWSADNCVVT